eukprot:TRINITY_DN17391_c0_g2_i1.p1 TRINITY_DN17391_c0_g2~~TRINITY_DN17391_c0_g2_i1.p1  ORF type:complete len:659 (-),score=155.80 TRINITY_DN17391_c0_g2_i1:33-2009(-)
MARAALVAKSKLLSQLRPYAAPLLPHLDLAVQGGLGLACEPGRAPLPLVPEVCGVLRSLNTAELQVVLAAYSQHAPELPELQLQASASEGGTSDASTQALAEVLTQRLAGGSHLGSSTQMVQAARTLAEHAPCDSPVAPQYWSSFAERISRLASSDQLQGEELMLVFQACEAWEARCGNAGSRRPGVKWAHMVRSVGSRLAEPQHLDRLPLPAVVQLTKTAARLGEPQLRLAAAAGLRFGSSDPDELSSEDIIDLIGATGKLGGRLHMMTRALCDHVTPQVSQLPMSLLIKLCRHLGALEMFPQRVAAALEEELSQRLQPRRGGRPLAPRDALHLLRAKGRLRWRLPDVIRPVLQVATKSETLDNLDGDELAMVLFQLYRLDVWDEALIAAICQRLRPQAGRALSEKAAVNALLSLSYFSYPDGELYQHLVHSLLRKQKLGKEATYQLKTVEMAIRVGHAGVTFADLGNLAARWLFAIRQAAAVPEVRPESEFADDVSAAAQSISWRHEAEVEVGPYLLDFAAVVQPQAHEREATSNKGRALAQFCVALEADGPSHFYRPHGRPWHWTSASKLRHRLLTFAGIRVAHVPFYDWAQLERMEEKEAYLEEVLIKAHNRPPPWKNYRASGRAVTAEQPAPIGAAAAAGLDGVERGASPQVT